MNANIQIIAKEGWFGGIVLGILFLAFAFLELEFLSFIFLVGFIFWLFIFRNPERIVKDQDSSFLSPVDGVIKNIDILEQSICVQIYTGILDVGVVRAPCDISHATLSKRGGVTLCCAKKDKKELLNETFALKWKNFCLEFFPEFFTNSNIYADSNLVIGERCGYMKKGITKIYLPKDSELKIGIGDKVVSANSVIGFIS
ncbi:MAG: phosphatidylserine decarboxylase [Helicobacter sp.]|nr:phosphatidylserine decarboxylase [Helicobacter sp.]